MKNLALFVLVLVACFGGFQVYRLYQDQPAIEESLGRAVAMAKADQLASVEEIREYVGRVMEEYNADFDRSSFPVKFNEETGETSFSLSYQRYPQLYVVDIPVSFHVDVPSKQKASMLNPNTFVEKSRNKTNEAQKNQDERLDKALGVTQ